MIFDGRCNDVIRKNISSTIAWYLMASYAYYHEDNPIISDACYDKLSRMILEFWKDIKHPHKKLIKKADLEAGTLLLKKEEYPSRVPGALHNLRETKPK